MFVASSVTTLISTLTASLRSATYTPPSSGLSSLVTGYTYYDELHQKIVGTNITNATSGVFKYLLTYQWVLDEAAWMRLVHSAYVLSCVCMYVHERESDRERKKEKLLLLHMCFVMFCTNVWC